MAERIIRTFLQDGIYRGKSCSCGFVSSTGDLFRDSNIMRTHECLSAPAPSGIEAAVCRKFAARQRAGVQKYGMTLAENPAGRLERLRHAQEEAMDLVNYLEWEIQKTEAESKEDNSNSD